MRYTKILNPALIAALLAPSLYLVGCSDDSGDIMQNPARDAGTDSGSPDSGAPVTDSGSPDSGSPLTDAGAACPTNPTEVRISTATITASTTWDCSHTYVIDSPTPTFVMAPAVLTIGPGTTIRGASPQSAIIITRGARLEAAGTAAQPIVFTSNRPVGMRRSGDWGGVVLLGNAAINDSANMTGATGTNQLEGLDSTDMRGRYGGGAAPDDASNCGTLRYVRIEFAGYTLSTNNELNGLTVCACGSGTTLDYVQVHRGADDGIELFGGTANLRHAVITQSDDDGLDWDQGWRGKAQFIVVQGPAMSGESDPSGIEADNDRDVATAMPVSEPTIYNATILGPGNTVSVANNRAVVLRRGTAARMGNFLLGGFPVSGIDVRDPATFALATGASVRLQFTSSIIWSNGANGMQHFLDNAADTFDEGAWFNDASRGNRAGVDPMLPAPYDATAPGITPPAGSPASTGAATPPDDGFFDTSATFLGAVPPGASSNWMTGWTAFPAN